MKSILIPTALTPDTLAVLRTVLGDTHYEQVKVVLLLASEMPYGITEMLFSNWSVEELPTAKRLVLEGCRDFIESLPNTIFHIHHQVGITQPLLRNILDHHNINLVVIPSFFYSDESWINRQVVSILMKSACSVVCISEERQSKEQPTFRTADFNTLPVKTIPKVFSQSATTQKGSEANVQHDKSSSSSGLMENIPTSRVSRRGIVAQRLLATSFGIPPASIQNN